MLKYKIKNDIDDVLQKGTPGYERVQRLKRRILDVKPEVCLERALIVTDFYKKNESMPVILKRANVFYEILDKMTIYILPDELIVGHQSEKQRSAPLFPEFAVEWVKEEMETFLPETRTSSRCPARIWRHFVRLSILTSKARRSMTKSCSR